MAADLEPIDIDINMRQNVSEEAGKASQANEEMTKSVELMQKEIDRLNKVVTDMSTALEAQRKITEANADEFEGATRKIEEMQTALDKASKELDVYQEISNKMNEASREGADISDILNEARENLSDTEQTLIDNAHELIGNQEEINNTLEKAGGSTDVYSASNQILSHSIKAICENLGIENAQIRNTIGNVRVIAAVKKAWTTAVQVLNTQLGLSIGLSRAFVATGIGAIIAAIGLVIVAYQNWSKKQQEAKEKMEADARQLAERMERYNNTIAESASKPITAYKKLQKEWDALADNLKAKEKFISDNKKEFESLGIQINNVADAENVLVANTDAVVKSFMIKARAAAASELAAELYKKAIEKQIEAEKRAKSPTKQELAHSKHVYEYKDIDGHKNVPVWIGTEESINAAKEINKEADKLFKEADDLTNDQIDYLKQANEELKKAGITPIVREPKKPAEKKDKQKEQEEKANKDLAKKSAEYQKQIDAARIAAMQEGAEKQRAALKVEYDRTKAFMEQELKELEELEKITGNPATEQRNQLMELDIAATTEYENKLREINETSKKAIDAIFADAGQRFQSELDNNLLHINQYYDNLIAEARKAGATIEQINELNTMRGKEQDQERLDAQIKALDFETQIALRRENMAGKFYLLEADRQLALLKIQENAARKTIEILKKKYEQSPTKELENDIKEATVALEGFGKEEKNLKLQKLRQAADYIAEAAGMLNSLFKEDGAFSNETMEQITSTVGSIAQGFASGGIIGGAMAAAGEAINLINAASAAEKRHQEALKVLQQAKIAMQREYLQLLLEEQLQYKNGTSIFGTDAIGKVVNAIDVYRKSIKAYKEEMQGGFTPNEAYEKSLEQGASKGGIFGFMFQKRLDEYRKQLDLYSKGAAALYNAEIVTGHKKTGLFGWGKGKDTYSKILDVYPDVIDAEGKLNKERVQSILDTRKMNDETRNLLQTLLDLEEQAEAAQEEMRNMLESTFGTLGDSLATAIVDAFATGDDALMSFKDNVTDVLNGFAKQMVYSQFLSKMFTGLQGDIEEAYNKLADGAITEKDLSKEVTDLLGGFFNGLGGTVDQANQFLEEFWKNAEAAGFTRPGGEREGTSAGIERISQDSANELNGNFYAIRQQIGDIRNLQKEANTMRKSMQAQLTRITENTEYCRLLENVKNSLEDMQTRGIKVKV